MQQRTIASTTEDQLYCGACFIGERVIYGRVGRFVFLLCLIVWGGCIRSSPALFPIVKPSVSGGLQVFVKPIVTTGFDSEDEQRWGVDFSGYYTAFAIQIRNNTDQRISINPAASELTDNWEQVYSPLDEKESIAHYQAENRHALRTFLPGYRVRMDDDIQKIILNRLVSGTLDPGAQMEGMLYFKKIKARHCEKMTLTLKEIRILETGQTKRMSFPFSCAR